MKQLLLSAIVAVSSLSLVNCQDEMSCDSPIYCQGSLLDTVQTATIFNDSKTFVDLSLINSVDETLSNFDALMTATANQPTRDQIRQFVNDNFESSLELEDWSPPDHKPNPAFLRKINNLAVRDFARDLVAIWPNLARKVRQEVFDKPDRYSLIAVPNGFIAPGGRFRELYYWDTYWIIKGLLISEMPDTVRGILDNFISIIKQYGFVPNGGRVYYLNRSQPPLLTLMAEAYIHSTGDYKWLAENINYLDKELQYFLAKKTVEVEKNGIKYLLAHYNSNSGTPRPESYLEDIETAGYFTDANDRKQCFADLKSGAESGWDFSSRWIFDSDGGIEANLSHIETRRVIPVDLNSFLSRSFRILHEFYSTKVLGDKTKSVFWLEKALQWEKNIQQVLYDEDDGIWYDFDMELQRPRKYFYPSNLAPLWTESYYKTLATKYGRRAVDYLQKNGISDYQGGIPTSLIQSGEQWDFPNAWAPLQAMVIFGLEKSGDDEAMKVARDFAKKWVRSNIKAYQDTKEMYEKYNAIHSGEYGSGGEYIVQSGFGWTNGVALELIEYYYTKSSNKCI